MTTFDEMTDRFTGRVNRAVHWRDSYPGAAYSTRLEAAIRELREAIAEAEQHPEIDTPATQTGEAKGADFEKIVIIESLTAQICVSIKK